MNILSGPELIRKVRIEMCLEQDEFAGALGTSQGTVHNYETGKSIPRLAIVKKLRELAQERLGLTFSSEDFLRIKEENDSKRQRKNINKSR